MKQLRRILALCAILALSLSTALAYNDSQPTPSTPAEIEIAPRAVLLTWDVDTGTSGQQETPSFRMNPGDGEYLRWYFENDSWSSPAHVYLYDVNKGQIVSAMSPKVDPGEERTEVYYVGSDSELCEFTIIVESMDGASVSGLLRAKQIHSSRLADSCFSIRVSQNILEHRTVVFLTAVWSFLLAIPLACSQIDPSIGQKLHAVGL